MKEYPPECPFCKREVAKPVFQKSEFGSSITGLCKCGAVYVCDPTGHNLGEAYAEALALVKGDWNIGEMEEDKDYRVDQIDYDLKTHTRIYNKGQVMKVGKLLFVQSEKYGAAILPQDENERPAVPGEGSMKLKKRVREALDNKRFEDVVELSLHDRGVLRALISLSYDKDDIMTWRAIESLGLVAKSYGSKNIGPIRDVVRRMIWSMTDEAGAIGWSAPEILGEIIRSDPEEFSDIIPILWSFREEGLFAAAALWAIGRVAEVTPDAVRFTAEEVAGMLKNDDAYLRACALRVLGVLGTRLPPDVCSDLMIDARSVRLYGNGEFTVTTISSLAENVCSGE